MAVTLDKKCCNISIWKIYLKKDEKLTRKERKAVSVPDAEKS
jgi:hypothetical protein